MNPPMRKGIVYPEAGVHCDPLSVDFVGDHESL
jgi:hypothetical protein